MLVNGCFISLVHHLYTLVLINVFNYKDSENGLWLAKDNYQRLKVSA